MIDTEFKFLINKYPDFLKFHQKVQKLIDSGYFIKDKGIFINRTPGRLDLMGGNDDYTGGLVFEKTIREATLVAIQPRKDNIICIYNPAVRSLGWVERIEITLEDLIENHKVKSLENVRDWINSDPLKAWCAYIIGDLYYLLLHFQEKITFGFSLYLESDVPLGKGVSSSAALEVAPMKTLAAMYGITVEGIELASWTQWVEIALTQSACGIMDQLSVVMGDEDFFLPMLCQPCQPRPLVRLPEKYFVWGIDSGIRHTVSGIEYEAARAATFMGYRYLCDFEKLEPNLDKSGALPRWIDDKWHGYLANISPSTFREDYEKRLPDQELGSEFNKRNSVHLDPFTSVRPDVLYPVRGATRYAIEENWRVHCFFNLISQPSPLVNETTGFLLGELMYQSHIGYTECGLGSDATDKIVSLVREENKSGLLGAKITGGGAGGTVAVLGWNTSGAQSAFDRVVIAYRKWSGVEPYIFKGSSAGCDVFGVQYLFK
jgi:galactokinase